MLAVGFERDDVCWMAMKRVKLVVHGGHKENRVEQRGQGVTAGEGKQREGESGQAYEADLGNVASK